MEEERNAFIGKENALAQERKQLHAAMEVEHRKIIASKMKLSLNRKINGIPTASYNIENGTNNDDHLLPEQNERIELELNAMAEAFKDEESKISSQKQNLKKMEEKLNVRKQKMIQKQKV